MKGESREDAEEFVRAVLVLWRELWREMFLRKEEKREECRRITKKNQHVAEKKNRKRQDETYQSKPNVRVECWGSKHL